MGMKSYARGFTLIEVLAVLIIISVMLGIAMPNYYSHIERSRKEADSANIMLIEGAVKQFRLDTGTIPDDLAYLMQEPAGGIPGWKGPYLKRLPTSPNTKHYELDAETGRVIAR